MHQIDPTRPSSTELKPISSAREFNARYSETIDEGIISITERTSAKVLSRLEIMREDKERIDRYIPSHFYGGNYYFATSSERYKNVKNLYRYDINQNEINLLSRSLNPHFFKNVLIEFGIGFNTPGPQSHNHDGRGVITVYDLAIQHGTKEIRRITLEGGSCGGWDGDVDEDKEEITAFDHVTGKKRTFPIFNKV
jgi:hypothetical protein